MKAFFKELFEYNHQCNQNLAVVFYDNPDICPEKAIKTYNHLLNAHQIWNNRIDPKHPPFGVWEVHPIHEFRNIDKMNFDQSLSMLDELDLQETISYTNSKGKSFNNRIQDVLFHIINHSTYHRGQIATEFRRNGMEPLVTDYIFYKR